jgi:hypothetical protein
MSNQDLSLRLILALVGKLSVEVLLLTALISYASWSNFHPLVRGTVDLALPERVAGWVFDPAEPLETPEVQLFIDGHLFAAQRADQPRPDLVEAGATPDPNHGFAFLIQPATLSAGQHRVEVFVVRPAINGNRTLIPFSTEPKSFLVEP